ncbi:MULTISPECIES: DUF3280 domain-containing protein [Bradyrhizobium]|jgi:uncharacterized protein DUF2380|uniref:DUF3280 domain-containing protein n=1 Tax=Bradyrhizobium TaxID=374 RepID=UPI000481E165|nr:MULTISPECIES: DUF3280 domain-containing protein [Bradyrhizobium]MCS3449634.1 hypothetical protein [Bradyrhizobium elkanii]MCS3559223.1 hypothetical protein [Bradyrhizobium elkanii]MCW2150931.1 hypothetical protein [Bradyrhizobium elkanii]MCW2359024.1 hypothetical protein [Bradyrhizobium elkanii]MCW2374662.1 hypothetical protein [Bradyrhizobium elkanii]
MRQPRLVLLSVALIGLLAGICPLRAETGAATVFPLGVSIDDFGYVDTSGEVIDQTAAHQRRLDALMRTLRADVAAEPYYRLVPSTAPAGEARIKVVGGVQKMSTLIQWAKVAVIDVSASQVLYEKLYTFRGDTDEAWDHAAMFVSREVRRALAAALPPAQTAAAAPIGLAVFEFELEDTSAATASGLAGSDAAYLADVTKGVRDRLAQSGRYRLVDTGGATAEPVKAHALRDCDGCEAAIAQQLGADQSLIGVIRRVSRTEYTVGFQLRDARSGAVVSRGDSGLRMGADYSWTRGAVRLVGDRLLEGGAQR